MTPDRISFAPPGERAGVRQNSGRGCVAATWRAGVAHLVRLSISSGKQEVVVVSDASSNYRGWAGGRDCCI